MLVPFFKFSSTDFYTLHHHHQVIPIYVERDGILIEGRELKTARFQLFIIDHQTGIFHVQDFHYVLPPVYKNEYTAIAYIVVHGPGDNAAKGVEALAHIDR